MSTVTGPPSPSQDCQVIHKALKAKGVDEKRLIQILAHRSSLERKLIKDTYQTLYNIDLLMDLESKLHGNLQEAMVMWMLDKEERDAVILHKALKSWVKDYNALIEVICTRTTAEIAAISEAYRLKYNKDLEEDISCQTNGIITKLLIALVMSSRSAIFDVNLEVVRKDAKRLYKAGKDSKAMAIVRTMSERRNKDHLQAILECYRQMFGQDLKKALKKRSGGAYEDDLCAIIKCLQSPANYFAKILYKTMKGLGTNDDVLIRVITTRVEVDMDEIKEIYFHKYKTSLMSSITKDTTRDFKDFLLELIK